MKFVSSWPVGQLFSPANWNQFRKSLIFHYRVVSGIFGFVALFVAIAIFVKTTSDSAVEPEISGDILVAEEIPFGMQDGVIVSNEAIRMSEQTQDQTTNPTNSDTEASASPVSGSQGARLDTTTDSSTTVADKNVKTPGPTPVDSLIGTPSATLVPSPPASPAASPSPSASASALLSPSSEVLSKVFIKAYIHANATDQLVTNAPVKLINKKTGEEFFGVTDASGVSPIWNIPAETTVEVYLYPPRSWSGSYCGSKWTVATDSFGTTQAQHLRIYPDGTSPCYRE